LYIVHFDGVKYSTATERHSQINYDFILHYNTLALQYGDGNYRKWDDDINTF